MKESSLGEHLSSSANVDAKTRACMRLKCDLSRALETSHDTAGKNLTNMLFISRLAFCLLAKELARCLHGIGFNLFLLQVDEWGRRV